jgi:hypothetical protein
LFCLQLILKHKSITTYRPARLAANSADKFPAHLNIKDNYSFKKWKDFYIL